MPTVLTDQEVLDLVRQRFPGDEARILAAIGSQAAILRAQLADNGGGIIGVTPPAGYTSETLNALLAEIVASIGVGGDHGALTGLADDDHPQYLNQARGDARYSQLGHTHAIASVTGLQAALDGKLDDSQASAAGLAVLGAADAAAQRTALGLGTAATSALSTTNAAALGTAAPGSETTVARADHVHPMPTAAQVGAAPASHTHTASQISDSTATGRSLITAVDAAAGRTALGLGTAATQNTGASGAAVPLLNGANTWSATQTFSGTITYGGITQAVVQAGTNTNRAMVWNNTTGRVEQGSDIEDSRGNLRDVPVNVQNGAYTLAASDRGRKVMKDGATAVTYTLPTGLPSGTTIIVRNKNAAGNITISRSGTALRIAGSGTNANATLAPWGEAVLHHEGGEEWVISGTGVS